MAYATRDRELTANAARYLIRKCGQVTLVTNAASNFGAERRAAYAASNFVRKCAHVFEGDEEPGDRPKSGVVLCKCYIG